MATRWKGRGNYSGKLSTARPARAGRRQPRSDIGLHGGNGESGAEGGRVRRAQAPNVVDNVKYYVYLYVLCSVMLSRREDPGWPHHRRSFPERSGPHPSRLAGISAVAHLGVHLTKDEATAFFAARGSKSRFGCRVKECCPKSWQDMLDNPVRHSLVQRSLEVQRLSNVPEQHRAQRFLEETVRPTTDAAVFSESLSFDGQEHLANRTSENRKSLERASRRLGEIRGGEPGGVDFADTPASGGTGLSGSSRVTDQDMGGRQWQVRSRKETWWG